MTASGMETPRKSDYRLRQDRCGAHPRTQRGQLPAGHVDTGLRTSSPDETLQFALGPKGAIFLVCDGMGGAAAGEVASTMAVDSISSEIESRAATTRERYARSLRRPSRTRTTKSMPNRASIKTSVAWEPRVPPPAWWTEPFSSARSATALLCFAGGQVCPGHQDQSLAWQLIEAAP